MHRTHTHTVLQCSALHISAAVSSFDVPCQPTPASLHHHCCSTLPFPSTLCIVPRQARVRGIAEIVNALVAGVRRGEDVDLNAIKRAAQIKYSIDRGPKLVEIIAALPEEHKAVLLPQ